MVDFLTVAHRTGRVIDVATRTGYAVAKTPNKYDHQGQNNKRSGAET